MKMLGKFYTAPFMGRTVWAGPGLARGRDPDLARVWETRDPDGHRARAARPVCCHW